MRWLDGITDMNLSKLREIVKDRDAWHAAVHGVTKSRTQLSDWTNTPKGSSLVTPDTPDRVLQDTYCWHSPSSIRLLFHISVNRSSPTSSVQFSSFTQSCLTLCNPMNCSTPGLPVHHQLPEFTQTHVHWVGDAIQPSHLLSSPSSPAPNPSQHRGLFQWVNSSNEVAKVLEFQLQHQSFSLEWTGWISLQSKGLSRVFSNTTVQKHQFFSTQLSSQSNSHIHT